MQLHRHIQSPIVNTNKTLAHLEQMEDLDSIFSWEILIAWVSAKSQNTLIKIDQPN